MDYYKLSSNDVLSKLKSNNLGLNKNEVLKRQDLYGKNIINIEKNISFLSLFIKQFKSFLVWLLIIVSFIALVSGVFFKKQEQLIDGIIIMLIVFLNAFVGAYQDFKSEKSAKLLKSMLKTEAIVMRGKKKIKIDSSELVIGDIIFLNEGDKVPADCRILNCNELHVDESMLTGESIHVLKNNYDIKEVVSLSERKNMVYMNTFVVGGDAMCVVVSTGKNTEIGKIAKSLENKQDSLFLDEVDEASKKITYVAFFLIIIALSIYYIYDHHWMTIFMLGSALIIGSIPEGLPAIVTFSLSISSSKLAKKNVLVKRKTLLETLGSVDVICTDKTGTLTQNKMTIKKLFIDNNIVNSTKKLNKITYDYFKSCALLCNEAKDTDKGFVGSAEDIALIDFFNGIGIDILEFKNQKNIQKLEPFSSEKKYASVKVKENSKIINYLKGAPEIIISKCKKIVKNGKIVSLSNEDILKIEQNLKMFSDESLRNIAFSFNDVFIGFVGIYDSPKKNISNVINTIYDAGIDIKMITGDNIHTAKAIAKECKFKNIKAISWDEIKNLSENQLSKAVLKYNVFARMSPEYKLKIVNALQNNDKRVAITGDGVNDVPALKKANVGVAMGKKGSDIAKEAADLILLDDNLESIIHGIKEGRTIFSNIRKVINYLLTANLAEVLLVFIVSLLGLVPFLAIQLLWVNFVTDIAPAMALGVDPSHKNIMKKNPTGKSEKIINKRIIWLTIAISIKKVIIMLTMFLVVYKLSGNIELAQTMTFTWLVISHFVRLAAIRFDENVNLFVNNYMNLAILIPILIQLIILYTPFSSFFHTIPLTIKEWIIILLGIGLALGLAKIITYIIDKNLPQSEKDY
jgi:Ca2+-transporting ATPase